LVQQPSSIPYGDSDGLHAIIASAPPAVDSHLMEPSAPPIDGEEETPSVFSDSQPSAPPPEGNSEDSEYSAASSANGVALAVAQPTPAARASHARRSLGLDLPSEEAPMMPVISNQPAEVIPVPRFLPKYEP
jgi:hypothetical protein